MSEITGTAIDDTLIGTSEDDIITGGLGNDIIEGGAGNDRINGDIGDDVLSGGGGGDLASLYSVGGRDTLVGGEGVDSYYVSLTTSGGSEIQDSNSIADFNSIDVLAILASNTDTEAISNTGISNTDALNTVISDPNTWGDSAIELSLPQPGIVGLQRSETDLIIDLNRDGNAESQNDLTVVDFFDEQGQRGDGHIDLINNINDTQAIIDFFEAGEAELIENLGESIPGTVYRFLNNDTGVHFYTAGETERDAVALLDNYTFEGASYQGVDPLTGANNFVPVYRFLNEDTGVHLYTVSETERDAVEDLENFAFEGEAFNAYATEVEGSIPIYRFFNSTTGAHFYTPSAVERDVVLELPNYESEGIAYYALPILTNNQELNDLPVSGSIDDLINDYDEYLAYTFENRLEQDIGQEIALMWS